MPAEDVPNHRPPKSDLDWQVADRFRQLSVRMIFAGATAAALLAVFLRPRLDPAGSSALLLLVAALLAASRRWWSSTGHERMADACGTVSVVALGGMVGGAIAMLELLLRFSIADPMLHKWDAAIGFDGIAVVEQFLSWGHWIFWLMAPAYNFTIPLVFSGLVALAWTRDRVEAWRAAFCFVGTLLTVCLIAAFMPAKGLGVWLPPELAARLPANAMKSFWAHFDSFISALTPS